MACSRNEHWWHSIQAFQVVLVLACGPSTDVPFKERSEPERNLHEMNLPLTATASMFELFSIWLCLREIGKISIVFNNNDMV